MGDFSAFPANFVAGQMSDVAKALKEQVAEVDKLASTEQKVFVAEVLLAETRLAAVNLVCGDDGNKLQASKDY